MKVTVTRESVNVAEQAKRVQLAKRELINYDPFFRYMAARHDPITDWSCPSPTACTDSVSIWFNPGFVSLLTPGQIKTVLAHELLHVYWRHAQRRKNMGVTEETHPYWNKAGDYRINAVLRDCGFEPVPGWLWSPEYADEKLSTEDLFRKFVGEIPVPPPDVPINVKPQPPEEEEDEEDGDEDEDGSGEPCEGDEEGDEGEGEGEGDGEGDGKGRGKGKGDEDGEGKGRGKGEGEGQGKGEGEGEGKGDPNGKANGGGGGDQTYDTSKLGESMGDVINAPHQTAQEEAAADAEARTVLRQAAQLARAQGKLPGSLASLVEEVTVPKVQWHDTLRNLLHEKVSGDDYSFRRPNKRYAWADLYVPCNEEDAVGTLCIIRDTSGSCSGDLPGFNAHVGDIITDLRPRRLIVLDVDSTVRATHDIEWQDGMGMPDEIKEVQHGGGTSFKPGFDWLEEQSITPDAIIYLTDLCGDAPEHSDVPTFWCAVGTYWIDNPACKPKFGEIIEIKSSH